MAILEVNHVQKIYKSLRSATRVEALSDLSFHVEKGEYVAIMGESGSGKSTCLNILAALDKPTAGSVLLNGKISPTSRMTESPLFGGIILVLFFRILISLTL